MALRKRQNREDTPVSDNRHSFCTQIVSAAGDPRTAQTLTRHKDGRSTDNYYHACAEVLLEAVQKIDNKVVDLKASEKGIEKA